MRGNHSGDVIRCLVSVTYSEDSLKREKQKLSSRTVDEGADVQCRLDLQHVHIHERTTQYTSCWSCDLITVFFFVFLSFLSEGSNKGQSHVRRYQSLSIELSVKITSKTLTVHYQVNCSLHLIKLSLTEVREVEWRGFGLFILFTYYILSESRFPNNSTLGILI